MSSLVTYESSFHNCIFVGIQDKALSRFKHLVRLREAVHDGSKSEVSETDKRPRHTGVLEEMGNG